jgi:MFS family permease
LVGPLIASLLISNGFHRSFAGALVFFGAAALGLLGFKYSIQQHQHQTPPNPHPSPVFSHPFTVLKSWFILIKKVWTLYLFLIAICLIDTVFWTTGTVLSEKLKIQSFWGAFLLPAYSLPSLLTAGFTGLAAKPAGKKRAAFITAAISGLLLIPIGFVSHIWAILGLVFLSSIFLSISFPEIAAVFEDYVTRLGESGDNMVGLQASAFSLAYIVGPIFAGAIASLLGDNFAFVSAGLLVAVVSVFCLFIVPRKIRLPESELTANSL